LRVSTRAAPAMLFVASDTLTRTRSQMATLHPAPAEGAKVRPATDENGYILGLLRAELAVAQRTAREIEDRLRMACAATRAFTWEAEIGRNRLTAAPNASQILGFAVPSTIEEALLSIHPEDRVRVENDYRRGIALGGEFRIEGRLINPVSENTIWLSTLCRLSRSPSSGSERVLGVMQNVTEQQEAGAVLRQREAFLSAINNAARVMINLYQIVPGRILYCNGYSQTLLGFSPAEMCAMTQGEQMSRVHPDDQGAVHAAIDRSAYAREGETVCIEYRYRRKQGNYVWLGASVAPFQRAGGNEVTQLLCVMSDITERKLAQERLIHAREELELRVQQRTTELNTANAALRTEIAERTTAEAERQEVLGRIVTAQEEERRRISRELHDEIGQHLTALMLGLKALEQQTSDAGMAGKVRELQAITETVGKEVHEVALGLRPTALDDLGLVQALSNYAEDWSVRSEIQVEFFHDGFELGRLPAEVETALYRIVQEALNNILKHARATHVSIILERKSDRGVAIVEDNGCGFELSALADPQTRQRLGLRGMEERAALVNGELRVESSVGQGTTVFVRVPLHTQIKNRHEQTEDISRG
jgi:PAS domain S-box-containing protein